MPETPINDVSTSTEFGFWGREDGFVLSVLLYIYVTAGEISGGFLFSTPVILKSQELTPDPDHPETWNEDASDRRQ